MLPKVGWSTRIVMVEDKELQIEWINDNDEMEEDWGEVYIATQKKSLIDI